MRPNLILSRLFAAVSAMLAMVGYVSAEPYSNILPSSEVRKLYQDSDGYIWIPTYNGLARYDGYGVVTYGMHDVSGVAFNSFVNVVAEDRDKVIWIGTERGLFRLDKKTGTISATGCEAVDDCNISVIICDTGNGIWVGSDKGLFRKNASEHYFRPVTMRNADGKLVTDITSVVKDANCSLWVASYGSGLLRYDLREERTYTYDDEILRHAHVVFCDADGNVWVGTWGAGLIRLINPYAPGRMQYARYMHREDDDTALLDDIVYAIEEDITQNTLWVGTRSGLSILHDPDHRPSFQNFKPGGRPAIQRGQFDYAGPGQPHVDRDAGRRRLQDTDRRHEIRIQPARSGACPLQHQFRTEYVLHRRGRILARAARFRADQV